MAFIFGGNTGASYEDVQKKRRVADALLLANTRTPQNVGEGLNAIGRALAARAIEKRASAREGELRDAFQGQWDGLFGGGGSGVPAPSGGMGAPSMPAVSSSPLDPNDPVAIGGDTMAALGKDAGTAGYRASLIGTESGGNWKARNNEMGAGGKPGHFGRVQFGQARLQEAMDAGAIPQGTTPEQFMNSPALQIAAENWHFGDLERQLSPLVGTEVNGQQMDLGALVAIGHLGGAGGARKFVETGGQYNPADAFGTNLSEYAATHGGQQPSGQAPGGQMNIGTLAELAGSPFANPGQKAVVEALLQQQMQAMDPMRRIELERAQLELAQLRDGGGADAPAGYRELELRAIAAGLEPGSPEFQQFMLSGGGGIREGRPAAFEALHQQAIAAGLVEGSDPYKQFMLTKGAGEAARAKEIGTTSGTAAAELPGAQAMLGTIDTQINDLLADPYLPNMLGSIDSRLPNVSSDAARVQSRINQLGGGAFLQARQMLKGGGAITDFESQRAEEAFARLQTAQKPEDFAKALQEFRAIVAQGVQKLQAQSQMGGQAAAPQGGGQVLTFNPETGELE